MKGSNHANEFVGCSKLNQLPTSRINVVKNIKEVENTLHEENHIPYHDLNIS